MAKEKSILAQRIIELRKNAGMTQEDLCNECRIGLQTVINYENSRREPSGRCLVALEKIFDVSGAYIFGLTDNPATTDHFVDTNKMVVNSKPQFLPYRDSYNAMQKTHHGMKRQLRNCHRMMVAEAVIATALGIGLVLALAVPASAQPVENVTTLPPISANMTLPTFEEPELIPVCTAAPAYDVPLPAEHYAAVVSACETYDVPLDLALAAMGTESCYQPDADNGVCTGYFQINRNYAEAYIVELGVQTVTEPLDNIRCGVWYLGQLLKQYNGETDHALMAYNLGTKADRLWAEGTRSTNYTEKIHQEMDKLHGEV